jgi:hypothetical protein
MEPERPIEQLLRQTAHRRQAQAGERFELHPADRRALQDEVARQYAAPPARTAGWPAWLPLWPRLVWAVGLLAVLGIIVWGILPNRSPQEADLSLAQAPSHEPERLTPPPTVPPPSSVASGPPAAMPAKFRETPERAAAKPSQADELHPPLATPEVTSESPKSAAPAEAYFAREKAKRWRGASNPPPPPQFLSDALATDARSMGKAAALRPPSPAPTSFSPGEVRCPFIRRRSQTPDPTRKNHLGSPQGRSGPQGRWPDRRRPLAILSSFSVETIWQ